MSSRWYEGVQIKMMGWSDDGADKGTLDQKIIFIPWMIICSVGLGLMTADIRFDPKPRTPWTVLKIM